MRVSIYESSENGTDCEVKIEEERKSKMKSKIVNSIAHNYSWKRFLYTLCFTMFCIIDQRVKTASGLDGILETFRDTTGIVLAVILFSHFKAGDLKKWKIPYLIWGIAGIIGGVGIFLWGMERHPFLNDWAVIVLNVVLWGFILLHTFIQIVLEKRFPVLNKKFLAVWGVLMLLMIISRSDYTWPFCYMVMFGCFYLTDYTKEEQEDLWQGGLDGILISFFLFQGYCCVFRPYDQVRYVGIYANCNINALYYLAVLAAVFAKLIFFSEEVRKKQNRWIRLLYWLVAGAVLSFLFMTIGRTAWMTAVVLAILFLWILNIVIQKKRWVRNGMILILCAILMFPICFSTVRYLPPVFHHPVWFWGEWSEGKVHSWDAWNSEKFVDIDELLGAALGRVTDTAKNILQHSPFMIKTNAAEAQEDPRIAAAVLDYGEASGDPLLVRRTIYEYYLAHLNWRGHPYAEQGFQLTRYYWIGHAHNIYLQYGTDFGIPVMVLFMVLIVWSCAICRRRIRDNADMPVAAAWFFILVPAVFGLLEYSWGTGSLSIVMLFIAWGQVMQKGDWQP